MTVQGNTTSSVVKTITTNLESKLNFIVTNLAAVTITLNIAVQGQAVSTLIAPKNLQLLAGESFELRGLAFSKTITLQITTTGSTDYYLWTT